MTATIDPMIAHLKRHRLTAMHAAAERVGYRVRVANGMVFHLEYQGGLDYFYQRGLAVKIFPDTFAGRLAARAFLKEVREQTRVLRIVHARITVATDLAMREVNRVIDERNEQLTDLEDGYALASISKKLYAISAPYASALAYLVNDLAMIEGVTLCAD